MHVAIKVKYITFFYLLSLFCFLTTLSSVYKIKLVVLLVSHHENTINQILLPE